MAGSKERWSGRELREYVKERIPRALVITRKPANRFAMVISESGKVLYHGSKNFEVVEQITRPKKKKEMGLIPLLDIPQERSFKNSAENAAAYALFWLTELTELMNNKCIVKYDVDGFPTKIKCKGVEFSPNGKN